MRQQLALRSLLGAAAWIAVPMAVSVGPALNAQERATEVDLLIIGDVMYKGRAVPGRENPTEFITCDNEKVDPSGGLIQPSGESCDEASLFADHSMIYGAIVNVEIGDRTVELETGVVVHAPPDYNLNALSPGTEALVIYQETEGMQQAFEIVLPGTAQGQTE